MILLILIGALILLFVLLPFFLTIDGTKDEAGIRIQVSLAVYAGAIGAAVYVQKQGIRLGAMLFGRRLFAFAPPRRRPKAKRAKPAKIEKEAAEAEQKGKRGIRELWSSVRRGKELFDRFQEPAFRFLRSLLRALRVRSVYGNLTFGTGDPAETGMVFGWLMALREVFGTRFRLDVHPDFVRKRMEGRFALMLLIKPYRALGTLLALGGRLLWDELRRRVASWRAKRRVAWRAVQA